MGQHGFLVLKYNRGICLVLGQSTIQSQNNICHKYLIKDHIHLAQELLKIGLTFICISFIRSVFVLIMITYH